jgi:L-amino acid N-acyltransferase
MEIRLARSADAEAIRRIYNEVVTNSTVTFDVEPRTAGEQRAWMADHEGAHPALVAVEGVDLCGFGSLSTYRDRPAYATSVEDSVYVDNHWRGRGIGKMLLEELVRIATEHGFHTVLARTTADNAPSISLHESCGFRFVGTEREVGRKFGKWLDVTVLQRMLDASHRTPRRAGGGPQTLA